MIEQMIDLIGDLPPVATAADVTLSPFEMNESSAISEKAKEEFAENNLLFNRHMWVVGAATVATTLAAASLYNTPASSVSVAAALTALAASTTAILTPMASRALAKHKGSNGKITIGGALKDDTAGSFGRFFGAIGKAGNYAVESYGYITATPEDRQQMKDHQSNRAAMTMDKFDHMSLGEKVKTICVDAALIGLSAAAVYGSSLIVDPTLEHAAEALKELVEHNPKDALGSIMGIAAANNAREFLSFTTSKTVNIATNKTQIRMNPVEMMACGTVGVLSKAVDGYRKVRDVVGEAYFQGALIASDLSAAVVERVEDTIHHLTPAKIEREYTSPIDRILRSKMGMETAPAARTTESQQPQDRSFEMTR